MVKDIIYQITVFFNRGPPWYCPDWEDDSSHLSLVELLVLMNVSPCRWVDQWFYWCFNLVLSKLMALSLPFLCGFSACKQPFTCWKCMASTIHFCVLPFSTWTQPSTCCLLIALDFNDDMNHGVSATRIVDIACGEALWPTGWLPSWWDLVGLKHFMLLSCCFILLTVRGCDSNQHRYK